ncbi:hypothetical protein N9733_09550 [Akkermansiaceae bacterium]|nr:hypothetical protein [Akkermansiaceae bacterium]
MGAQYVVGCFAHTPSIGPDSLFGDIEAASASGYSIFVETNGSSISLASALLLRSKRC